MTEVYALVTFLYGLAALLGLGLALFAEVGRVRAVADGTIDEHERTYLARLGVGLWTSVLVFVIANPLIVYLEYRGASAVTHVFLPSYWFQITLALFIMLDLLLMTRKQVSLWFGGAVSLTAYAGIAYLFFYGAAGFGYFQLCILYALAVFVVGGLLEYAHILTRTYGVEGKQ